MNKDKNEQKKNLEEIKRKIGENAINTLEIIQRYKKEKEEEEER